MTENEIDRRNFLKAGLASATAATLLPFTSRTQSQAATHELEEVNLTQLCAYKPPQDEEPCLFYENEDMIQTIARIEKYLQNDICTNNFKWANLIITHKHKSPLRTLSLVSTPICDGVYGDFGHTITASETPIYIKVNWSGGNVNNRFQFKRLCEKQLRWLKQTTLEEQLKSSSVINQDYIVSMMAYKQQLEDADLITNLISDKPLIHILQSS